MKPRVLLSKVTSSMSGSGVDNWSHNHRMEIEDPLRASVGGVTPSSSPHNSSTSNTHVSVIAGLWIRSLRMIATSCNVIVITPMGYMKCVCLGLPSLDKTSEKWPINHDVAQAVYIIESRQITYGRIRGTILHILMKAYICWRGWSTSWNYK